MSDLLYTGRRLELPGIFIGGHLDGVRVPDDAICRDFYRAVKPMPAPTKPPPIGSAPKKETCNLVTYLPVITQTNHRIYVHFYLEGDDIEVATAKAIAWHG